MSEQEWPGREAPSDQGSTYPSLGVELEMVPIDETGRSACVGDRYFHALARRKGREARVDRVGTRAVAVVTEDGVNGIDNGFNLLETALSPEPGGRTALRRVAARMNRDLAAVLASLEEQGLALTSLAQHPTAGFAPSWYHKVRAPKSIYDYLIDERGWHHALGIDAKAQNGPTTGTTVDAAIHALNILLAASPAFIGLFANSPFEDGRVAPHHETRMTLWPRMLADSRVAADRDRIGLPPAPFASLGHYMTWMFGPGTVMHAVPAAEGGYKGSGDLFVIGDGQVNAPRFFGGGPWPGRLLGRTADDRRGYERMIHPSPGHLTFLQWSNFLDFRIRFSFNDNGPPLEMINRAFENSSIFNEIFALYANNLYLENRCVGATFVDDDLIDTASDAVCRSAMIAPSALQAGLVAAGHDGLAALLDKWSWPLIQDLRTTAIRRGVTGVEAARLRDFASDVIALAADHLPKEDHWALDYPRWVLRTGATGAMRALSQARREGMLDKTGLERLAASRRVRVPPDITDVDSSVHGHGVSP